MDQNPTDSHISNRVAELEASVSRLKESVQRTATNASNSLAEAKACMEAATKLHNIAVEYEQAADDASERFHLNRPNNSNAYHNGYDGRYRDQISLLLAKADIVKLFEALAQLQADKAVGLEKQARLYMERMEW